MKPVIIIAVAVVAVVAAVVLLALFGSFSAAGMATASGNDIVLAALNRTSAISAYIIHYNITNFIEAGGETIQIPGDITVIHSPFGEKISIVMQVQGQDVSVDIYKLVDGTYSCENGLSGSYCQKYNDTLPVQNPIEQAESLMALAADGTVGIASQGTRNALRPCNAVSLNYDLTKLFSKLSVSVDVSSAITEMSASICFDRETGLPLEYEQVISMTAETALTSRMRMTATQLELTAPDIALPEGAVIY